MANQREENPCYRLDWFFGSGKNHVVKSDSERTPRSAYRGYQNEFGEIGIDNELIINAEEEVFEMNNGCICCTVRGDLIRILGNLAKKRGRFDHVMIETTGMADPAPVAQTFFVDEEVRDSFVLDGVVTLIDSKHISQHISDTQMPGTGRFC